PRTHSGESFPRLPDCANSRSWPRCCSSSGRVALSRWTGVSSSSCAATIAGAARAMAVARAAMKPPIGFIGRIGLLHCDAFGEVVGPVDVAAAQDGDVVGQQLQRNRGNDGREKRGRLGDAKLVVVETVQDGVAL